MHKKKGGVETVEPCPGFTWSNVCVLPVLLEGRRAVSDLTSCISLELRPSLSSRMPFQEVQVPPWQAAAVISATAQIPGALSSSWLPWDLVFVDVAGKMRTSG